MVAPITGPFNSTVGGTSPSSFYSFKSGYKQARPLDQPLAYTRRIAAEVQKTGSPSYDCVSAGSFDWIDGGYVGSWVSLENRAYDRLKNKISDRANWAVNLSQASQSLSMIQQRALQLSSFARRLRRLDFLGAASALRSAVVPKGVSTKKSFANNYLEFHFGWSPLIGDIYSSIDVLQQPVKDCRVKVNLTEPSRVYHLENEVHTSNPNAWWPSNNSQDSWRYLDVEKGLEMGVEVAVNNPNLWLANQLGLVNPALLVYELIPFSFVANWFVNIEQFLSSGTDFYGLTLKNGWHSKRVRGTYDHQHKTTYRWVEGSGIVWGGYNNVFVSRICQLKRQTGIVNPTFAVKPWQPWGWRRTAAAVSLLVQRTRG